METGTGTGTGGRGNGGTGEPLLASLEGDWRGKGKNTWGGPARQIYYCMVRTVYTTSNCELDVVEFKIERARVGCGARASLWRFY